MTKGRLVVSSSVAVVALGVVAALSALILDPARAAVGPLPPEGLALPADARFLVGLDVKRFTASPFYQKYSHEKNGRPQTFKDLEEKTGLNPERDVDQVVIAGGQVPGREGVVLVFGRFDQSRLAHAIETQGKEVTWKRHEGVAVYLFREGTQASKALAFLDDRTLLIGSQQAVETTIANRAQGGGALRSNQALMDLLQRVKPGSTFWMVGDQTLLAQMPKSIPAPGAAAGSETSISLPALKSLVVTGELSPAVTISAVGDAADEAAAKNLADVVRGFAALAALQANQKPELKELASAISVTTETVHVRVNARFPYELLDALHQQRKPATAPEAAPQSPPAQ